MEKFKNHTTQKQTILKHLNRYKKITNMQAYSRYEITRLSEYIRLLRKEGFNIPPVEWKVNPRSGNRYGIYRLKK